MDCICQLLLNAFSCLSWFYPFNLFLRRTAGGVPDVDHDVRLLVLLLWLDRALVALLQRGVCIDVDWKCGHEFLGSTWYSLN